MIIRVNFDHDRLAECDHCDKRVKMHTGICAICFKNRSELGFLIIKFIISFYIFYFFLFIFFILVHCESATHFLCR